MPGHGAKATSKALTGGVLPIACKTRRASQCPPCAKVYRADTYQLIRAGLSGGKGIPGTVATHPCVFTTLTAPSFGPVHARQKAFRDAVVVDQLLPSNPVERAKRPRKALSEPGQVWTPGQLRAFLDAASKHRLFAFYRLAAYTGARRGELLNLRWRDIDLDGREVRITGSVAVIAGQRIEGTTKSGRSRTVSIDTETVQVLREHRKRQTEERLSVGPEWRGAMLETCGSAGRGVPSR